MMCSDHPDQQCLRVYSPLDLLRQVEPAYGPTWDQAVTSLLTTPSEARIVEELRAVLRSGNQFTEPVVITNSHVSNGMHRSVASLLENQPILAADHYPNEQTDYLTVEFRAEGLNPNYAEYDDGPDGEFDHLIALLRSFPLPDGAWFETSVFGYREGRYCLGIVWPLSDRHTLETVLRDRCAEHGVTLTEVTIELSEFSHADEHDEPVIAN